MRECNFSGLFIMKQLGFLDIALSDCNHCASSSREASESGSARS